MTWFAFPGGWGDYNLNGVDEKSLALTGAHGYATKAQADAHVNASPTLLQQGLLQGFKAESTLPVGAGTSGDLSTSSSTGGVANFLSRLSNPHLWLRVVEVIVGGAFLIIGLNALLHNPAGKAAKVAAAVRP